MVLDERKGMVLRAIVEDYVASAEPIGSRTLARTHNLGVSSATIRNEMADLEALGLLDKPHTSAGRVPSDRGYRLYVDRLMEPVGLAEHEFLQIQGLYLSRVREMEYLIAQTMRLLTNAGDFMTLAVGPELRRAVLMRIEAVAADEGRMALVLVTDYYVQHRMIELPDDLDPESLRRTLRDLSERLRGLTVEKINRSILELVARELSGRIYDELIQFLHDCLAPSEGERLHISGTSNFLSQPEFREADRIRAAVQLIEQESLLGDLLRGASGAGVQVRIGQENPMPSARDLSIVTIGIERGGEMFARFGLVAPKRMDYARALALAQRVWQALDEAIN
ncbi:MAG: heat-inducible transcriptional repressor HrcA [Thermaerobacter sp.]|nr:heat-inducible transcriptional repressor HrcA [Thermaerobacter sp.]